MLYSTLLLATAAFSGFAAAQNSTSPIGACCTVSAGQIPDSLKSDWCRAEQNTCPDLCGGQGDVASGGNDCDDNSLEFTCKCKNGTEPKMSDYQQSVPGQMCRYWFDLCINATGSNLAEQYACTSARDSQCGNKTIGKEATSASASVSRTASATSDSGSATSAAGASASASSGAGPALAMAREYGTPMLAGGLMAVFGLAL